MTGKRYEEGWNRVSTSYLRHHTSPLKMVRSAGVAPASPDWHTGILLLNDDRVEN
jgi:hypothetical protein